MRGAPGECLEEEAGRGAAALREHGFTVLEDAVDPACLAVLRERMLADLPRILQREHPPYNFNTGNVQHDPPPFPPYLFREVLLNERVIAVTRRLLGEGVKNAAYTGNTCLPGNRAQPVHADMGHLWPPPAPPTPAYACVVNVPLVAMDAGSGATELWPGSHEEPAVLARDGDLKVPAEALARRRAVRPPVQPSVPCGGVLIRDIRLWHRGMPNHSSRPRPMIAMIHWIAWWRPRPIEFPGGTESFFAHPRLRTVARFVPGPIEYLLRHRAYDCPHPPAAG